ncbi:hypothetical protein BH23BAC3_BH23BAC3_28560 [soil metagenome]
MTHRYAIPFFLTVSVFLFMAVDAKAQIFYSAGEEIRIIPSGEIDSEFILDANANSLATDIVGGHIYWSETAGSGSEIKRANLNGTDITVVVDQNSAIRGLALDLENDRLYWVDLRNDGKIYRADLNGDNIDLIVDGEGNGYTNGALDIALDLQNGKLYWSIIGAIMRSDLDGGNVETAFEISSFVQPSAIEVNSRDRFVYWVNTSAEMIMRADMNSGVPEIFIDADEPYGLSVDVEGGKIFWIADFFFEGTGQVSYANLDGTGAQSITNTSFTRGAISGSGWEVATSNEWIADQPTAIRLSQNYPNPFNPQTVIEYHLPESQAVTLTIHNAIGQQVAILAEQRIQNAGSHKIEFDASSLPSGVYFYQLKTEGFSYTRKMTLLK